MKSSINEEAKINQSMELVERFYKIVKEKLSDKETLKRISKPLARGAIGEISIIGLLLTLLRKVIEVIEVTNTIREFLRTIRESLRKKLKKHEELPTIEDVLRKGEIEKEEFFRKEPAWIDFEKGCIVERKEVNEIIEKLENDKIHLVLGEPASGKSVILKNIGFKLAKQGKKVYFIDLKRHSDEEVEKFFEKIPELNAVSIIDDAHLKLSACKDPVNPVNLVKEFKRRGKGSLLIGSREVRELRKGHPKYSSEFEYLNKTKIEAKDATEDIIRLFLKRKHNLDDSRIKTISKNLEQYKHDLWLLSWALLAYNPEKDSVEKEEIVEKVKDSIREIKKNGRVNAEEVFYPLSVFYRFEIPVEERFIKELGIDESTIDDLLSLGELIEVEERGKRKMLLLHHSSIADIYFEAYKSYPDLGRKLRNWDELSLFYKYLEEAENSLDVIIGLGRDLFDKKGGKTTLRKLVESKDFVGLIRGAINEERDLEKIGRCLFWIARASERVALELVDPVASKINEERDLEKIGRCLSGIAEASKRVASKIAEKIDVELLSSKINEERDLEKIGWCLSGIAEASKRVASKIAEKIDVELLSSKINEERDLEKIGSCLSGIAEASKRVASKIAEKIDVELLSSKINEERDLEKIGSCLSGIARASKRVKREILKRLRPELREILGM